MASLRDLSLLQSDTSVIYMTKAGSHNYRDYLQKFISEPFSYHFVKAPSSK